MRGGVVCAVCVSVCRWNRGSHKGKVKWETLEHNGILFPPPYIPHRVPLLYDGQAVELSDEAEEVATFYAAMLEAREFVDNPVFNANFWRDFRSTLTSQLQQRLKELRRCDFSRIHAHVTSERDRKKAAKKEQPHLAKAEKEEKERLQDIYGFALVDGYKEKVGNFRVEPPALFRGRGKHPKTGRLKLRVKPEDIIINIGPGVPIPPPPAGHQWKGVMHNNKVTWLAFWHDNVNDGFKYVWLAASSKFKGQSDIFKYTKAQRLKLHIDSIRRSYYRELGSKKLHERQRATAIYLIDVLALRVGNEKDKSEVADTVGCCSLRVEHLSFDGDNTVTLNFLGKDSMQYLNTVQLDARVYACLQEFCRRKAAGDEVFDTLTTTSLNEHLKSLMDGLTAKVFRTYNASITLQKELTENPELDVPIDELVSKKVGMYTKANRIVAILCNHQRSVPKGHEGQMKKLNDKLEAVKDEKEELEDRIEELTEKGKKGKAKGAEERKERAQARLQRKRERRERKRLELVEKAKKDGKAYESDGEEDDGKPRSLPSDVSKLEERLERVDLRLSNMLNTMQAKDESKTVALGTSKINYMDPRITVAWCKWKEVPIEKIFNKSLLAKFPWALEVPSTWRF